MVLVYGGSYCRICRRAMKWLAERGLSYQFIDLDGAPLEEHLIDAWIDAFGWRLLIDKRTAAWRHQPEKLKLTLDFNAARTLLLYQPGMLKRPVIMAGDIWLVGWNAPNKVRLLGQMGQNQLPHEKRNDDPLQFSAY